MAEVKDYKGRTTTFVTSSSGTLNLTPNMAGLIILTGSATGYTVVLPDCTNYTVGELQYRVLNASTANIVVETADSSESFTVVSGETLQLVLETGGTATGAWASRGEYTVQGRYTASMLASAVGVEGFPSQAPATSGAVPLVDTDGYISGDCAPFLVSGTQSIIKVQAICAAAAVSQGTVGTTPTLRIDVYTVASGSASIMSGGTLRLAAVDKTDVGVSNTLPTSPSAPVIFEQVLSTPLQLPDGTLFGVTFKNESTDNEKINAVDVLTVNIITELQDGYAAHATTGAHPDWQTESEVDARVTALVQAAMLEANKGKAIRVDTGAAEVPQTGVVYYAPAPYNLIAGARMQRFTGTGAGADVQLIASGVAYPLCLIGTMTNSATGSIIMAGSGMPGVESSLYATSGGALQLERGTSIDDAGDSYDIRAIYVPA